MIFISYSHKNIPARDQVLEMIAPLKRFCGIKAWSDKDIESGKKWKVEIDNALEGATVGLLLVTPAFLNSEFIMNKELPYLLDAAAKRGVEFLWVLVEDCMWKVTPLAALQSAYHGQPINRLTWAEQQGAWRDVGEEVLKAVLRYERPIINKALEGRSVAREEPNLEVLAAPARRQTEVFVYSENAGQWWHKGPIKPGIRHCRCHFGDDKTPDGARFRILAVTTDQKVGGIGEPPDDRARSEEVVVIRKNPPPA